MTFQDQFFARKTTPVVPESLPKAKSTIAAAESKTHTAPVVPAYRNRSTLAYTALLAFSFLYYARPEDFVPGLGLIPVGKISGGIALLGLLLSWNRRRTKMPIEIKLVLILFLDMCLTVPFAFWRGGAFEVVRDDFSKAAISALLISMIVSSLSELRKLLWVQAAAITTLTAASILVHPGAGLRMWGLGGGFSNPNDFAINIAINIPICLAFLLASKGLLKKLIWTFGVLGMLYGVIATYSRSGFIAMLICLTICVWEFGIRGKRPQVLIAAILVVMMGMGLAMTTPRYVLRLKTLVGGDTTGTFDHGSIDARRDLLMESIRVTFQHPVFGVGPGNFQAYTKSWHVTHNTYTELSSEAGIPALLLFLTILMFAFHNTARMRKTAGFKASPQIALFNSALRAGLAAYMVGAAFASTTYSLFPYFMVAYTTALFRIGSSWEPTADKPVPQGSVDSKKREKLYGKQQQGVLAGTR